MIHTAANIEDMTLNLTQEIQINAPLGVSFDSLLEQMGPRNQAPDGSPLPMKIEPWPGGRWFRDLGDNNGHLWGHVQAIKRPALLEIYGPLFASYPFVSNLQYRLTEANGVTTIVLRHTALGFIQDDHKNGVSKGWAWLLERTRKHAETH